MKVETLSVESIKAGMKQAVERFGADTVLLKSSREGTGYRLLVAHRNQTLSQPASAATQRLTKSSAQALQRLVNEEAVVDRSSRLESGSVTRQVSRKMRRLRGHPEYASLLETFDRTGISSALRTKLLEMLAGTQHIQSLNQRLVEGVVEMLPETREIDLTNSTHFLVGGYGVGKTSVAFKMARQINELEPGRAAVISFASEPDTSWTAATVVGAKLGVDVYPATSVAELQQLIEEKAESTLMLIDVSTHDSALVPALAEHFKDAEFHLVAPSDTCLTNLQRLSQGHKWDSLIITRLDSSSFNWSLYQVLIESQIPLSLGTRESNWEGPVVLVSAAHLGALLESGAKLEHNTGKDHDLMVGKARRRSPAPQSESLSAVH